MRNKEDLQLKNLLMEEMVEELQEQRNQLRQDVKRNIQKVQVENKSSVTIVPKSTSNISRSPLALREEMVK